MRDAVQPWRGGERASILRRLGPTWARPSRHLWAWLAACVAVLGANALAIGLLRAPMTDDPSAPSHLPWPAFAVHVLTHGAMIWMIIVVFFLAEGLTRGVRGPVLKGRERRVPGAARMRVGALMGYVGLTVVQQIVLPVESGDGPARIHARHLAAAIALPGVWLLAALLIVTGAHRALEHRRSQSSAGVGSATQSGAAAASPEVTAM